MKKNKFVKLIEHILVALPLVFVGVNALYTIFNENAKDNYSQYQIDNMESINSVNDLHYGVTYYVYIDTSISTYSTLYKFTYISLDFNELFNDFDTDFSNINGFFVSYAVDTNTLILNFFNVESDTRIGRYITSDPYKISQFNGMFFVFDSIASYGSQFNKVIKLSEKVLTFGYLNQIMEYSMERFNVLGFNKIPFTQFFVNIFHNGQTNVYIDFVNNYLNYMLFVECTYFIPMVLYWFIHFGEDVIDRFTKKGDRL